jgi:Flp pilus assembly protein TadD
LPADEVRYLAGRQVVLTFATAGAGPVESVELWVSGDGGSTWQPAPAERTSEKAVRHTVAADGRYDFYLVLHSPAGSSSEPPQAGSTPHVRTVVDTVAPTLQLHGVEAGGPEQPNEVVLRATLLDENLGATPARVFYRTAADGQWIDGGTAIAGDGRLVWRAPDVSGPVNLRVVATDLAGNRAIDELKDIHLHDGGRAAAAKLELNGLVDLFPESIAGPGDQADLIAPVRVAPVTPVEAQRETTDVAPGPRTEADLKRLRGLGQRFLHDGRYDLAAARLQDAVNGSPKDADLMVDLGSALYGARRFTDAEARYQAALDACPDQARAVEGLALVAAAQKRYPQARERLLQLLKLKPESGLTWLRYGDVEYRLGNGDKANAAWERTLQMPGADESLRERAQKRLKYFAPPEHPTQR